MKRSALSRADLLDALIAAGTSGAVPIGLIGYELKPSQQSSQQKDLPPPPKIGDPPEPKPKPDEPPLPKSHREKTDRRLQFLLPVEAQVFHDEPRKATVAPLPISAGIRPECAPLLPRPLVPWARLAPFLRRRLGCVVSGRRVDQQRLVRAAASGRPLVTLPRIPRLNWSFHVCLLWDTSPEMEPFWEDVGLLIRRLRSERGRHGLRIVRCHGPPSSVPRLSPGEKLLALSAMGRLTPDNDIRRGWDALGVRLTHAGYGLSVLAPCPARLWHRDPAVGWPAAVWDDQKKLPKHLKYAAGGSQSGEELTPIYTRGGERLLDLLAPASLITQGLLRDVRRLLGALADVGTEHEAWMHPGGTGAHSGRYFSFLPGAEYEARLERFQALALDPATATLASQAREAIDRHHKMGCSVVIANEARLRSRLGAVEKANLRASVEILEQAVERMRTYATHPGSGEGRASGLFDWFLAFVEERLSAEMRDDPSVRTVLAQGWALARHFHDRLDAPWPARINEDAVLRELRDVARKSLHGQVTIFQVGLELGTGLVAASAPGITMLGGKELKTSLPLVHMTAAGALAPESVRLEHGARETLISLDRPVPVRLQTNLEGLDFKVITRPAWASRMWYAKDGVKAMARIDSTTISFAWTLTSEAGTKSTHENSHKQIGKWKPLIPNPFAWAEVLEVDDFGIRAEFHIRSIPFVLRWIPPGRFLMGSPEDEPGRFDNEDPRHEVRITRGFWIGETPVTQAQWRAVVEAAGATPGLLNKLLGKKTLNPTPSHFKGPVDLPVESVNWEESVQFCRLVDALVPGRLGFRLPTEAQWEYACRAGTETALFSGEIEILGKNNAPALHPVAWYGGNSGQDLEVTNPESSKDWPEKQFDDSLAGSHRVKLKSANPWGLYDVHGNVWEWCRDAWDASAYAERREGAVNPLTEDTASDAGRVLRGGSWDARARGCRAAIRGSTPPGGRDRNLGLRLSAGQEPAEPQGPGERSVRLPERRSRARRAGGSVG